MAIDPFDPWYLYDFWALRGKYGEEEKRKAQMREKIRREERDKFYRLMDVALIVFLVLGLGTAGVVIYFGIIKHLIP